MVIDLNVLADYPANIVDRLTFGRGEVAGTFLAYLLGILPVRVERHWVK